MIATPVAAPGIFAEELDDGICLYVEQTNDVVVLNTTAAAVWQLCDGIRPVAEIVAQLAQRYRQSAEMLRSDVEQVVADLLTRGYLINEAIGVLDAEPDAQASS
jgi:coenzyme PQQ biosynthesis protein PqqD